jgi:hypothetical protein
MYRFFADTTFDGPIFDSYERDIAMATAEQEIEDKIQDATYERVKELGQSQFRYVDMSRHQVPGKWLFSIRKGHADRAPTVYTDIIYGYWLEGIGSRNFPKTRFRGYRMWRETTQQIQAEAADLAEEPINKAVARLNK